MLLGHKPRSLTNPSHRSLHKEFGVSCRMPEGRGLHKAAISRHDETRSVNPKRIQTNKLLKMKIWANTRPILTKAG